MTHRRFFGKNTYQCGIVCISVLLKHRHNFFWLRLCAWLLACVLTLIGSGPVIAAALPPTASAPRVMAAMPPAASKSALPACCRSGHCQMRCCLGKMPQSRMAGVMSFSCRCTAPAPDTMTGAVLPPFVLPATVPAFSVRFASPSRTAGSQTAASHQASPAPRPPCRLVTETL